MKKNEFPVIEVPPSGKPNWTGGAWCLAWTYTTNGNYLLKGFIGDIEDYIKSRGWKCWSVMNLYHTNSKEKFAYYRRPSGTYRTSVRTFKCDFWIASPSNNLRGRKKPRDYRFKVYPTGEKRGMRELVLKRLPKQFVDFDFEPIVKAKKPTLGDLPGMEKLN